MDGLEKEPVMPRDHRGPEECWPWCWGVWLDFYSPHWLFVWIWTCGHLGHKLLALLPGLLAPPCATDQQCGVPPALEGQADPRLLGCGVPVKDNCWLTGDTWAQEGVKLRLHVDPSTPSHVPWKISLPKCQRLCHEKSCLVSTRTLPREELPMHTFLT